MCAEDVVKAQGECRRKVFSNSKKEKKKGKEKPVKKKAFVYKQSKS